MTLVDELVQQARTSIDDLRQALAWLSLLAEPGRDASTALAVDDDLAERLTAQGMQARAYRDWNLTRGLSALPPTAAAARLGVLDAQAAVHGLVLDVARLVAAARGSTYVGMASGGQAVVDALDWLEEGHRPDPWITGPEGVRWRAGPLDSLRDGDVAGEVAARLQRANTIARRTARVLDEDPVQPLEHHCPACGRQSLQLHYDRGDLVAAADGITPRQRSRWYAQCISGRCRCTVEGCGCGMRMRIAGRRHAWAWGELPDLWRAIERAQHRRHRRVGRSADGRGWGILGA